MSTLGTRILLSLSKEKGEPEGGATERYTLENGLGFLRQSVPDFDAQVRGKYVLDYGSGHGYQAVAMALECGVAGVYGVDIIDDLIDFATRLAQEHGVDARFSRQGPDGMRFDVVLSCGSFEHFNEPEVELDRMKNYLKPDGKLIITFAEPWYSNAGSHFSGLTRIPGTNMGVPWINLLFSDEAMLALREKFRGPGPRTIEDAGLNRMSLRKFERIIRESGMRVERLQYFATRSLPLVTKVPVLRELLTSSVSCTLTLA